MLIIISIIYYVFLRYSPEQIITYKGYAIEGKTMVESLKNSDMSNVTPYLGLIEVQENDLVYKRLNSYYIGEDDKKEIDINYPIYINEGNALLNLGENTKLITVNYEEVEGYPDFMMADGVMYNGADITRADGNKYLFLKSEDGIYTNVSQITINTANGEYNIKEFSNIYFAEDYIAYYEMEDMKKIDEKNENSEQSEADSYLQYKQIKPIDPNSKTKINDETITYKTLLERLEILQTEESNKVINNETENVIENETKDDGKDSKEDTETKTEENTVVEETTEQSNIITNQNIINMENNNNNDGKDEWQEGMWEKPEVSCTDFETGVYSATTNLSVRDRAGVISRGVMFELYLDGRLNRRVLATQVGNIEITNLQPSSEYEIKGIFYYTDEDGVERQEEFYNGTATTKSIDTLGTIDFSFQNGEIYSNKIELIHLKVNNNIDEEVIKGISRVQVEIGDVAYRLSNNQVNDIKAGKEITYQTSESLTSNSKIKYKITAFDRFGNKLKEQNNVGETITSKQVPRASIRPTKQDVTEIEIEVTLSNKDNVKVENYRYEITNQSGEVVKQGTLDNKGGTPSDGHKETLKFNYIDPNGYYQIVIYGDYDLENGTGVHQNAELGRASFVTRPLASLGYMQVKIDDKEITQNSMDLGISIDENQTDARLLAILDKVEVVIYDQGKNVENVEETEIQHITFTKYQVSQLKTAEEVELNLQQLNSNTKYRIDVITTVRQGTVEEIVEDKQNIEQLITLKMPAEVQIKNQFVIGTMIDLDMRIEDPDNAVLTNQVRIEVRNKDNKLVDLSEMPTNAEYERKVYEDLTPNEQYRIIVYAPQYNIGSTDETYEADYILKEIKIVTETGISGRLDLIGLEKTPTGKNLVDVSSKVNWYEKCFNTGYKYGLSYNEETKILTMGGSTSYNNLNYYDLSKYLGQEITISFKARKRSDTNLQIVEKDSNDLVSGAYTAYYGINNLNDEWQEYSYTVMLNKTGYIGFYVTIANALVEIQDLQIELGNRKTDYEKFKYDYNANIAITLNDARNEIATNDYYIRIYKNNEQIQELRYEEIGENNKVENAQKTYNIEPDANYKIELLVKIGERFYEIDSQEFSTEGSRELKGIFNKNDFLKIQPYGEYIVLDDIDLTGVSGGMYQFGSGNIDFEGKLNFNGNTLTRDNKNNGNTIFWTIGKNGLIENIEFNVKMNNTGALNINGYFIRSNYGTIRNIQINLIESTAVKNTEGALGIWGNYGTFENFVVNLEKPLYIYSVIGAVVGLNYGVVKNGYMYGENIKMLNDVSTVNTDNGGIVYGNRKNAIIENVYTLVGLDTINSNQIKGSISRDNYDNAIIQNVYSVGIGKNTTNLTSGPNVYTKKSKKIYNNYYFADKIFTSELETKGNKLSLWDAQFQNQLINRDGAFIVDDLVNEGYYPHINMPDCMPAQDYIELPEVEDADLPDILSTKVLEQGTDTVKVQFSVNNPSAEQVSDIEIANLEVEILSQEYKDGKSTVIAELKNPDICVSSYDVISLSTKGAFDSGYTRPYEKGERVINVDLYKEIWNVNDWKDIKNSPIENYMLMADLNFVNEGNSVAINTINGIINGNGHTISNINFTGDVRLIRDLYGSLENIYIKNFKQYGANGGGLVFWAEDESVLDNVHGTNFSISVNGPNTSGGLLHYATYSTVRNSSINNVQINVEEPQTSVRVGGIVGRIDYATVENCYVTGLKIIDSKGVNSGTGGIVGCGLGTNSIRNCYAEGTIDSENLNVGGIIGDVGTANVENCYAKINISTTNNNAGGIVGRYSGEDTSTISNNLSIGNIYTTSGMDALNRIVGTSDDTIENNYAYEKQLLNGYAREEEKGATLLNKKEILNLDLGTAYNYDGKEKESLPKLYNVEGTALLPNQKDIFVDDNLEENVKLGVENIETTKPNSLEADITVRIVNPSEIEITGLEIEDMQITAITRNVTQNGVTSITVRAMPTRYYDSYKLAGIKYKINNSQEEQTKEIENEIQVQFFKEIYSYEDWQSIEEGTYQNYRLMADIDFSGKTNIKNNITVNRLEAENSVHTLSNVELEYSEVNTGFINNVKTSIKNIGFENIILTNTSNPSGNDSGDNFGIITSNNGEIGGLRFKDITINTKNLTHIGLIGGMTSGTINNIEINNIAITGSSYIGGLVGYVNINVGGAIKNITGQNITIQGTGNYVGGFIGYQYGTEIETSNLNIKDSNVTGANYTGGISGYFYRGVLTHFDVDNLEVNGSSMVGGIGGYIYVESNASQYLRHYMTVKNSSIKGSGNYIGGIDGINTCGNNQFWMIDDSSIIGTSINSNWLGGFAGSNTWTVIYYSEVNDSVIKSNGSNVGGFFGVNNDRTVSTNAYSCYISGSTVQGRANVGGVVGNISFGTIVGCYVNANIIAHNDTVGGIVGYMDTTMMTEARFYVSINQNMVLDTKIKAPTKAGGLIGNISKEIFRKQSFYYNNYIDANVTSTNASTGSLIIGGRPDENDYIDNTYVYKYSKLNGNYVYTTNDNVDDNQYLVRTDLDNQSTYLSKIGLGAVRWNYASLSEGKYPKLKDNYVYQPELQIGVDLPADPEIAEINMLSETGDGNEGDDNNGKNNSTDEINPNAQNNLTVQNSIEAENTIALPDYKVYPISANEINVDFSGIVNDYNAKANVNSEANQSEIKLITNEVSSKENNEPQPVQNSDNPNSIINFTYYVNGQEQETIELSNSSNQTYTFKYNFKDTIEIKLTRKNNLDLNNSIEESNQAKVASDEEVNSNTETITNLDSDEGTSSNTETITITPEDVRSEASLTGENNAYLLGTSLYINGELQQGEYVNLYEGKALNSSGQVVDIATIQVIQRENTDTIVNVDNISEYNENDNNNEKITIQETTYLEGTSKPLHTYEYKGNTIEVYGTYSKINGNIKTQIYNVRSGKLSALSNSLDMKIGNGITDNYNSKEYQTILNTSGELIDLKEMLKYPDNFLARNIKQIVQNTDEEKTEVMVLYNTGKAIVFNYVTGAVVYENNEKANNGLADYLAGSIDNIWNDYEEKQQEYAKSKELEAKLAELPIEKVIEQTTKNSGKIKKEDNVQNSLNNNNLKDNSQTENENGNKLSGNSSSSNRVNNTNGNSTSSSNLDSSTNASSTDSDNDYITVYNAGTGKYEVYNEEEILNSNEETPVSETEKITQNGLEGIYGYNAKEETKPQTNGAIIVVSLIAVAIIALVVLKTIVVKNNFKMKK